jgi:hypothetical protein
MEAIRSSEMWVDFQRTTRHYIPEDRTLHILICFNKVSVANGKKIEFFFFTFDQYGALGVTVEIRSRVEDYLTHYFLILF